MNAISNKVRFDNIDILRGLVMIIMCIDHARDYTGIIPKDPMILDSTPLYVFWLRVLTHICAPTFIFLSGISSNIANTSSLNLLKRGSLLLLLEVTLVNWGWSFNPLYRVTYLQIIWAIGWGMIILAGAKNLNRYAILAIALIIIGGHNIFSFVRFEDGTVAHYLWSFVLQLNFLPVFTGHVVRTTYPILPVAAIMLLGYFVGNFYRELESRERKRNLFIMFGSMILLFVITRILLQYGDKNVVDFDNFWQSLFNMTKYPMSLNFILLYLSFAVLFLAITDMKKFGEKNILKVFGRVPLFFYVIHLYLLHIFIIIYALIHHQKLDFFKYLGGVPAGFGYPSYALLIVIPLLMAILYYPCCYYYKFKIRRKNR